MAARLLRVHVGAERLEGLLSALEEEGLSPKYLGEKALGFTVEVLVPGDRVDRVLFKVREIATGDDLAVLLAPLWTWPEVAEGAARTGMEELEATLAAEARPSPRYLLLLVGSAVLAYFGLYRDDAALLIASMVTAPLLMPAAALAWAGLRRHARLFFAAFQALLAGVAIGLGLGWLLGLGFPFIPQALLLARTHPNLGDLALALVAGGIGAAALLGGQSTSLVGVMVALALLPPLVGAGALFALGMAREAFGALLLFGANLASMMLASSLGFTLAFRWRLAKVAPAFLAWLLVFWLLWLSRP